MIATKSKLEGFKTDLEKIPSALRTRIQNVTVKLSGLSGAFKATGVILTRDDSRVYVLTALHNVYVLARKPNAPKWDDRLVTDFKEKVKIYYGAHDYGSEPANPAEITAAKPIHLESATTKWEYDILLLTSETAAFRTYAATAGNAVYPSFPAEDSFVKEAWQYLGKGEDKTPSIFVQTGYGNVKTEIPDRRRGKRQVFPADTTTKNKGTNVEGKLQYRIAEPESAETTSVYRQVEGENYEEYNHCIVLPADGNDSTESGDSGGPLFVAHYITSPKGYKLDLIGITLGADMEKSKTPCPTDPAVRVNNLATSLDHFYEAGLPR